jgi:hypothetical protein
VLPNLALWNQGAASGGAHLAIRAAGSPACDTDGLPLRFGRRSPGGPPEGRSCTRAAAN